MSYRYYETLTVQPDFSQGIQQGVVDERDQTTLGQSRAFYAWPGRSSRTFRLQFQTFASEEWRVLREFVDRQGGRAKAFYLPSWTQDLELAADAIPGATAIRVSGNHLSETLVDNRPDTVGRRLLIIDQQGVGSTHWVQDAIQDGTEDVLVFDAPIAATLEAGRVLISFCHLVRFLDDNLESVHLSPRHASAAWMFREAQPRRTLDQTELAAGVAIFTMKANAEVEATDQDPLYLTGDTCATLGPFGFGIPQTGNYQTEWIATLDRITNLVRITGPDYNETTPLYNAPGAANQIALTFDALSRPVLAWELDGVTTIARYIDPTTTARVPFTGYSPVAFNTFGIDATTSASEAVPAVFYLKRGDPTIYCRVAVESFATERRYCKSPLAPIYLHRARREKAFMEIVGMDAWHRLAIWRSEEYQAPIPTQVQYSRVLGLTGEYMSVVVNGPVPDDLTTVAIASFSGSYEETRKVGHVPDEKGAIASIMNIFGEYAEARVSGTVPDASASVSLTETIEGSYKLIAIQTIQPDQRTEVTIRGITGTYQAS